MVLELIEAGLSNSLIPPTDWRARRDQPQGLKLEIHLKLELVLGEEIGKPAIYAFLQPGKIISLIVIGRSENPKVDLRCLQQIPFPIDVLRHLLVLTAQN